MRSWYEITVTRYLETDIKNSIIYCTHLHTFKPILGYKFYNIFHIDTYTLLLMCVCAIGPVSPPVTLRGKESKMKKFKRRLSEGFLRFNSTNSRETTPSPSQPAPRPKSLVRKVEKSRGKGEEGREGEGERETEKEIHVHHTPPSHSCRVSVLQTMSYRLGLVPSVPPSQPTLYPWQP